MAEECCKLVGDLNLGLTGCIISVNTSCSTEVGAVCGDEPAEGPTVGTLNIAGYASDDIWIGCPSRAGVSISFVRKYDCENDQLHFIFNGQGQSFYTGEANQLVTLNTELPTSCAALSASSQSGPATIYSESTQINGYGMSYNGDPISFDTSAEGTVVSLGGIFAGTDYYLQSFNLELTPAQLPVATYSFVYSPNIGG